MRTGTIGLRPASHRVTMEPVRAQHSALRFIHEPKDSRKYLLDFCGECPTQMLFVWSMWDRGDTSPEADDRQCILSLRIMGDRLLNRGRRSPQALRPRSLEMLVTAVLNCDGQLFAFTVDRLR